MQNKPGQREQRARTHSIQEHRERISFSDPSEHIQRIERFFDIRTDRSRVIDERSDHLSEMEVYNIIDNDENDRSQCRQNAFVLKFQADPRDHVAEQAGQDHDDERDHKDQDDPAENHQRSCTDLYPVNDDRREDDRRGIQQSHQIDDQETGDHDRG